MDLLNILKIFKYNKILKKIIKLLGVEFDSQPVYDEKYIKTRVKTEGKVITNLQTIKFQKKILIILVLLQFVLIL